LDQNHEYFYGEIVEKKMQLSKPDVIADILWKTI